MDRIAKSVSKNSSSRTSARLTRKKRTNVQKPPSQIFMDRMAGIKTIIPTGHTAAMKMMTHTDRMEAIQSGKNQSQILMDRMAGIKTMSPMGPMVAMKMMTLTDPMEAILGIKKREDMVATMGDMLTRDMVTTGDTATI